MASGVKNISSGKKGAAPRASSRFPFFAFLLSFLFTFTFTSTCFSETELGSEDDLTVLGTNGTVEDPDTEIKGFTIFGSTNVLTHISTATGNVVINGALEVSSDVYVVGKSTFAGNVYIVGFSSANKYYGDGSYLTGVSTGTLKIGDAYGGGKVFWVDAKGRQALISATANQSSSIQWAPTIGFIGAGVDGIGGGKSNTVMITTTTGPGSYAARLCADYSTTVNGVYYDDWYLPSRDELTLLYGQKTVVGGFVSDYYWSSTEYVPIDAWLVSFNNGNVAAGTKTNSTYVRCVRAGPVSAFDYLRDAETVRDGAYRSSTQTFTGGNTFEMGVTASSFTATAPALGVDTAKIRFTNDNIIVSSGSTAQYGGVFVSTHIYLPAGTKYYGDGSGITNLTGGADSLGSHIATMTLTMNTFNLVNVSSVNFLSNVYLTSATAANYGGLYVST
ncbi:MAG: DUF1566 domain-containing protein, partial [Elusimicrobiota bacterium]|nr:DUF1566 domain-containing protein [Elusimicrobiota bacterium]